MLVPVEPVFHKYVPPAADGVAVRVALEPAQTVALSTVTVGIGSTEIVPLDGKLVQPDNV